MVVSAFRHVQSMDRSGIHMVIALIGTPPTSELLDDTLESVGHGVSTHRDYLASRWISCGYCSVVVDLCVCRSATSK